MTYVTKKTMNKTNENKYTKINAPIVEALKNAYENPSYQFHIPGHTKGNGSLPEFRKLIGKKALCVDTTDEFDGFACKNRRNSHQHNCKHCKQCFW